VILARDPAVPRRDELLRRRPLLHAKYRLGESLRVAYRAGGRVMSARTRGDELVTRTWPDDRKLTSLHRFAALGRIRVVAYAPEKSATVAVLDERGRVVAYAKATDDERRGLEHAAGLLVPRILATEPLLTIEAFRGKPVHDVHGLGAALARLHELAPPRERFARLDVDRLATAADVIARARPDAADAAEYLLTRLIARRDDALGAAVCLHGDANLSNALRLPDGRIALIDLEHLSAGPAAADLGQVLATSGRPARELLRGYATAAPPPDGDALRWYTAASILARVVLPGVSRVRPDVLVKTRALLETAADMLSHARAAA
jgi:Phosphotransferase enzyme family